MAANSNTVDGAGLEVRDLKVFHGVVPAASVTTAAVSVAAMLTCRVLAVLLRVPSLTTKLIVRVPVFGLCEVSL